MVLVDWDTSDREVLTMYLKRTKKIPTAITTRNICRKKNTLTQNTQNKSMAHELTESLGDEEWVSGLAWLGLVWLGLAWLGLVLGPHDWRVPTDLIVSCNHPCNG